MNTPLFMKIRPIRRIRPLLETHPFLLIRHFFNEDTAQLGMCLCVQCPTINYSRVYKETLRDYICLYTVYNQHWSLLRPLIPNEKMECDINPFHWVPGSRSFYSVHRPSLTCSIGSQDQSHRSKEFNNSNFIVFGSETSNALDSEFVQHGHGSGGCRGPRWWCRGRGGVGAEVVV